MIRVCPAAPLATPARRARLNLTDMNALGLMRGSLESYGEEALALGAEARDLVGVAGMRRISETLPRADGARIRGALDSLVGAPRSTTFESERESYGEGYDFVECSPYRGTWRS